MEHFYLDTNVFVSELRRHDPFHSEAKMITEKLESWPRLHLARRGIHFRESDIVIAIMRRNKAQQERTRFATRVLRRLFLVESYSAGIRLRSRPPSP